MVYGNNYGNTLNNYLQRPAITPEMQIPQQASLNSNLILIQGEAGAKSFLVAPNTEVVLFDSESPVFYKKAMTPGGISFRKFRYEEIFEEPHQQSPIINDNPQNKNIDPEKVVTWDALEETLPGMIVNAIKQVSIGKEARNEQSNNE